MDCETTKSVNHEPWAAPAAPDRAICLLSQGLLGLRVSQYGSLVSSL
jgi:hypothetical protein